MPGKVALSWRIDGQPLTQARCDAERLEYMDVDVLSRSSGDQVSFTEVTCSLDRYPLFNVPLGPLFIQVQGIGRDTRMRPCARRLGSVAAAGTKDLMETPVLVELKAAACP